MFLLVLSGQTHILSSVRHNSRPTIVEQSNTYFSGFPPKHTSIHLNVTSLRECQSVWHLQKIYNLHPVCQCAISRLIAREASVSETHYVHVSGTIIIEIHIRLLQWLLQFSHEFPLQFLPVFANLLGTWCKYILYFSILFTIEPCWTVF